jgi:uncharacterized protein YidB (DUF937 family)
MPRGNPSLIALLGLAAVAGYQHRDRINEMLNNARQAQAGGSRGTGLGGGGFGGGQSGGSGDFLSELGGLFGPGRSGGALSGGLGELLGRFQSSGRGQVAQSWVADGPNEPLRGGDVEEVIGDDLLRDLQERTGLSRTELVERLSTALPETVNHLTPQGRLPTETEAEEFLVGPDAVQLREPGRGS